VEQDRTARPKRDQTEIRQEDAAGSHPGAKQDDDIEAKNRPTREHSPVIAHIVLSIYRSLAAGRASKKMGQTSTGSLLEARPLTTKARRLFRHELNQFSRMNKGFRRAGIGDEQTKIDE
jgi:hypothetical protein